MSQFISVFALGYEHGPSGSVVADFRQSSAREPIRPEDKSTFAFLLNQFARSHLGLTLVDKSNRKDIALATTHYPPRAGESIDWGGRLFDSDGYEHSLVLLGGVEVVTGHSFTYCVWDRRNGTCLREGAAELRLSNTPMTDEERSRRRDQALEIINTWHASASAADNEPQRERGG